MIDRKLRCSLTPHSDRARPLSFTAHLAATARRRFAAERLSGGAADLAALLVAPSPRASDANGADHGCQGEQQRRVAAARRCERAATTAGIVIAARAR